MKQLKWFEWTTIYSLIAIDDDFFANGLVQSRLAAHLVDTIRQIHHSANPQFSHFIIDRVRTSRALKALLQQCIALTGNDQELNAVYLSLIDETVAISSR
jgi:hypothetical protein